MAEDGKTPASLRERRKTITAPDAPFLLSFPRRFAYGVGHVLNDLCASMWFSYLLVFYHKVLSFNNVNAGYMMLIGQVSDAMCTPLIGYESDKSLGCRYGKRKTWHLLGTICVMSSFVFIFSPVIATEHASQWAELLYFAPFIVIFQFGWASTQISHLSLIPELTNVAAERVALNAIRYTFTVFANIFVYGICWVLLNSTGTDKLSHNDVPQFRYLAIIVVGTGAIFSLIFHCGTKEPTESRTSQMQCCIVNKKKYGSSEQCKMLWKDWLFESQFYQVAMIYMCSRLMVNISQVYIPMYVTETLMMSKTTIALVPLVIYVSGFLTSFFAGILNKCLGRKLTYFLAVLVFLGGCAWLYFPGIGLQVYGAAALLGAGGSTLLVTSLALTSDLISHNTESGAFVYGAMSFTDKLSNGITVIIIQYCHPCVNCCPACKWFYRDIQVFVPGGAAIVGIIILLTLLPVTVGVRKNPPRSYSVIANSDMESEGEIEPCDECKKLFPVSRSTSYNNSPINGYGSVQSTREDSDSSSS
ncbi:major facilitator superfamily domain-containing protein 12-like [Patiria miniata]|uniref:Major facilitator superfamily domain-containing protein 12 n=1 Tax=Patiria miniata TaxID=46514 RepID=A0A914BAR3_PATMI|nr:major facilitator superfamily domain-containing protein 12-like [Patiria miniata]XP_038072926.1 major facilitator superfamily domain-containing protein 12-like [Patiria miniata]XP_038072927.1 major facilitator superfamily domain-containing protein 12-like [Patiria miniata]XP_038072928.1 major facilitator superfamily domain-containing protein 12-like [Patiria miniata]